MVRLNPNDPNVIYNLASLLDDYGKYKEALVLYEICHVISPDNVYFIRDYGVTLSKIGKKKKALNTYKKAILLDSNDYKT